MEEKLRVLVVDDELPIRQRLKQMDWGAWEAEWVGDADNGEVALDFCADHPPDVVVADITMPIMGGFELFHVLRDKFPDIKVILLTNHNDFEYARQAIKLGAVDYLLKAGFSTEELGRALTMARQALVKDRSWQVNARQQERVLMAEQFRRLVSHPDPSGHTGFPIFRAGRTEPVLLLGLRLIGEPEDLYLLDPIVQEWLEKLEASYRYKWFPASLGQYVIITGHRVSYSQWHDQMRQLTAQVKRNTEAGADAASDELILFAYGGAAGSMQALRVFHEQGEIWKQIYFYEESQLFVGEPPSLSHDDEELVQRIKTGFELHQGDQWLSYVREQVLAYAREQRLHPQALIEALLAGLRTRHASTHSRSKRNDAALTKLGKVRTLRELTAELVYLISGMQTKESRPEIAAIKNHVIANLGRSLSLSAIAAEAGYNPQYLGKLFLEETGESFKAFITRVRVEKAMELIWNTNKKIYLIAEEVGFSNYRYFTTLFQKHTGLSPTQYKKG